MNKDLIFARYHRVFNFSVDDLFLRETDEKIDVKEIWSIRLMKRIIPTTDKFNGNHFFGIEGGVRKATPLFLALVVIEVTDLVFAVDSSLRYSRSPRTRLLPLPQLL